MGPSDILGGSNDVDVRLERCYLCDKVVRLRMGLVFVNNTQALLDVADILGLRSPFTRE